MNWQVTQVGETGSTNTDLAAAARAGAPEGSVLVADRQTAGRGRQDRQWVAPAGVALTFSVLLRPPPMPSPGWAVLPLLAGTAVAGGVQAATGLEPGLKWPNDVLLDDRKLGGLLAEVVGDAVVVGIGLNVSTAAADLPAGAASLRDSGVSRAALLSAVLGALGADYEAWRDGADPLPAYRLRCRTLGRPVTVHLPGSERLEGVATEIDPSGRLVVAGRALSAGDVVHVR